MKIPPLPKNPVNQSYRVKDLEFLAEDGSASSFQVIPSRNSAYAFIMYMLYNMGFPMAAWSGRHRDYKEDPEWYKEDMENWEEDDSNFDEDTTTYMLSRGKLHVLGEETTLEEAIAIFRAAPFVESLIQISAWGAVLYNGAIFYDEEYDMWLAEMDLPDGWRDYKWKDIHGTFVEVYPPEEAEDVDSN